MKISIIAALIAALALPMAASAQQYPQQPVQQQPGPGQGTRGNAGAHQYNKWMKMLTSLNLSQQQQQQVQGMLQQFAQQHPAGSPRDREGTRALRNQIFSVLTPDQQNQLRQQMQAMRQQRMQRRQEREQQQQQQGQPQQQPPSR
jgi:Spy/CpxP family protein refolding chaperone